VSAGRRLSRLSSSYSSPSSSSIVGFEGSQAPKLSQHRVRSHKAGLGNPPGFGERFDQRLTQSRDPHSGPASRATIEDEDDDDSWSGVAS
jgi:hypothetical protein